VRVDYSDGGFRDNICIRRSGGVVPVRPATVITATKNQTDRSMWNNGNSNVRYSLMATRHDDPQLAVDATQCSKREPYYTAADNNTSDNQQQRKSRDGPRLYKQQ